MQGSEDIVIAIFIVSALIALILIMLVIGFLILYQRRIAQQKARVQQMEIDFQKELLRQAFNSEENERQRIAKDLHDDVGAMLSTVRLFVSKLTEYNENDELKTTTFQAIDDTINSVRRISRDLMPPTLDRFGLSYSFNHLAAYISSAGGVKVDCQVNDSWHRLPLQVEKPLFRIGQELLNNSLKHAQASQIGFRLTVEEEMACIDYFDDGIGIAAELLDSRNRKGMGLRNIESRASLIGATTKWMFGKKQGMAIRIQIPITVSEPKTLSTP